MSEFPEDPRYYDDEFERLTEVSILGEQASVDSIKELTFKASLLLENQPETIKEMALIAAYDPEADDETAAYLILQRETSGQEQHSRVHRSRQRPRW